MNEVLATWQIIAALIAGVIVHIAKKASTRKMENKAFNLRNYLLGNPYQTVTMVGGIIGAYFLLVSNPVASITLSAAFTAGVAANSLSDMAKGSR